MTPTLEELGLDKLPPAERMALAEALLASLDSPPKSASALSRKERAERARAAVARIAALGGVPSIPDPGAWQREIREDRKLPGRDE